MFSSFAHTPYYFSNANMKFIYPLRDGPYWKPFYLPAGVGLRPIEDLSWRQGRSEGGWAASGRGSRDEREAMVIGVGTIIAALSQYPMVAM